MMMHPDDLIPTRRSLLDRLKNWEDQESWRDFFDTYWKLIYGVAIRAGLNDAESQEVVQETLITVAKKMPGFQYDPALGSFKNWLLTTTRWKISDQFRKRTSRHALPSTSLESPDRTATIERIPDPSQAALDLAWDQEWQKTIFDAALAKIKRRVKAEQYQMFDLHVVKNWKPQKVAQTLGISVSRVYLAKYRISMLLKKEIKRLEMTMT
ncbi:MAG TPA: sigma-70 family RNA polymerase sigma factor [Candidatus Paceibacterota bacterium]|nr:sigma-70 family RNA polymerase sigma factor [Verrucomicrobiota bacterium]HRY47541.1 sigma-70 family RNA polymerase sigma factor [Candidatus Paceibacterota bacterium]